MISIRGHNHWFLRAVDPNGNVPETLVKVAGMPIHPSDFFEN